MEGFFDALDRLTSCEAVLKLLCAEGSRIGFGTVAAGDLH